MSSHRMNLTLRLALILAIILLAGAGATPATAGIYPVHACSLGQGNVNYSWAPHTNRWGVLAYARCDGAPGSLGPWDKGLVTRTARVPGNKHASVPKGTEATMTFRAPPGAGLLMMSYTGSLCAIDGFRATIEAGSQGLPFGMATSPDRA